MDMTSPNRLPSGVVLVGVLAMVFISGCAGREVTGSTAGKQEATGSTSSLSQGTVGSGQGAGQGGSVQSRSTPPGHLQEERVVEAAVPRAPVLSEGNASSGAPPGSADSRSPLFDVLFNFDRYSLRPDAKDKVEDNAAHLTATRDWRRLFLEGRCDEIGSTAYNLVLGERRAKAVKQYLGTLGIPASTIEVISYGKERPLCTEHNAECWQKNRSVHFAVK